MRSCWASVPAWYGFHCHWGGNRGRAFSQNIRPHPHRDGIGALRFLLHDRHPPDQITTRMDDHDGGFHLSESIG